MVFNMVFNILQTILYVIELKKGNEQQLCVKVKIDLTTLIIYMYKGKLSPFKRSNIHMNH